MPLILRTVVGRLLTNTEVDGNFTYLDGRINTVQTTANDADAKAVAAQSAAASASSAAATADGKAVAAQSAAATAQSTANTAKAITDQLSPLPTTVSTSYAYTLDGAGAKSWTALGTAAFATLGNAANQVPQRSSTNVLTLGSVTTPTFQALDAATTGGRITFQKGPTSALSGNVSVDLLGTQMRIFQSDAKGFYLDFTEGVAGVAGKIWHSGNFTPANYATANAPIFTGVVTIVGSGAGDANISRINLFDSDGVTRRGVLGDLTSTNDDMYVLADTGSVVLQASGVVAVRATDTGVSLGGAVTIDGNVVDNTDSGWITITLVNGWTGLSGRIPQYRRIGKLVLVRGAASNTFANNNTIAWNVPADFRASRALIMPATGGAFLVTAAQLIIATGGATMTLNDAATTSGTVNVCFDNTCWVVA